MDDAGFGWRTRFHGPYADAEPAHPARLGQSLAHRVGPADQSPTRSRCKKPYPPTNAEAIPRATSIAFAVQSGLTAGAAAIWWSTEVSNNQWLALMMPPTISIRNDQASIPYTTAETARGFTPNTSVPMPRRNTAGGTRLSPAASMLARLTPAPCKADPIQADSPAVSPTMTRAPTIMVNLPPSHRQRAIGRASR